MLMAAQSGMLIDRSASGCAAMKSEDKESFHLDDLQSSKLAPVSTMNALHIAPGNSHRIRNAGSSALHFIVISEPESHGD
jgi:hypothetical protein